MQTIKAFPINLVYDSKKDKWNKHPAIPKGQDWHTYESTEQEMEHAKNIGVIIPDGIVLIDVDTYKGVTTDAIDEALGCSLDWELAHVQETPSGGQHYAFALPGGVVIRQGSDLLDVEGFDTRTSGKGWIASGERYEDMTLTGLPGALCDEEWPELPALAIDALQGISRDDDSDDLLSAIAAQPLDDLSDEDIATYLKAVEGDVNSYDAWLKVGMACFHQFQGEKKGLRLWAKWSQCSDSYDEDELRAKWKSFGGSRANPITFAHVIHRAGGRCAVHAETVRTLEDKAIEVTDKESYLTFKAEVKAVNKTVLPDDLRAMLAATVAASVGADLGLTKTEIKRALMPMKKERPNNDEIDRPDWIGDWVYIEKLCEFANTELNYTIKREAFNAKFDRQIDCLMAEKCASSMALVDYSIDTVVDTMFWPGAALTFSHDGMNMLNTYKAGGCIPCDEIDEDGALVVDMLLAHIRFTLSDEREQGILLDWLAYVVQHPGQRINWALLLQGTQGSGKSYFVNLLQAVMGGHVRNLDPTAIAGRFTGWAHGALVVAVEEIRISGTNKYEVLDRLKPFISNKTIQIEEKGRDHRTVPNFTNYLLLTNHKDAIPLSEGDRRYCILFSRVQSEEQLFAELGGEQGASEYFAKLFDETERRADVITKFLTEYKISADFNPVGRAPATEARAKMMGVAISPDRLALEDAINQHECAVINNDVLDITYLNELCMLEDQEIPQKRALSAILLDMGYEQIEGRRVKTSSNGRYHYVWFRGAESDIKKLVKDFHDVGF